jgi:uncharacterized protein (DUF1800 family)
MNLSFLALIARADMSRGCARNTLLRGFALLLAFFATCVSAAPSDLNADGKSDLVLQDAGGVTNVYLMNGTSVSSANTVLASGSAWSLTHMGDLNGDGKADLLFRHADGTVFAFLMNGQTVTSSQTLLGAGSPWVPVQLADFNGDGKADILWRNSADGSHVLWLMNGTTIMGGGLILGAGPWVATQAADFNGDGRADILWRHSGDGSAAMWLMDGTTVKGGGPVIGAGAWVATHAADFNGDGKADILWRNSSDGSVVMWTMNGAASTGGATLLGAGAWAPTHVGDLNGDGKSDIVWRNTNDGTIAAWIMNGSTVVSATTLLGPGSGWTVQKLLDINGDGKADIVWRGSEGTIAAWLMNGFVLTGAGVVTGAGTFQVMPASAELMVGAASPKIDAARLLSQATFGATQAEIDRVSALGPAAYLEEQFNLPQTLHLTTVRNDPNYPQKPWSVTTPSIWKQYFEGNDQLRQKMVSALSQIVVVSLQNNVVNDQACGAAAYLDILGRNAFGNFRNLLKEVTLSPAMGEYLDMKQSAKADPTLNSVASENYARELLQLFSIGPVMLNQDGSVQFSGGKAINTYSEANVQDFAKALSGWTFAGQDQTKTWRWLYPDVPYPGDTSVAGQPEKACVGWSSPMQPWKATYRSSDDKRDITGGAHDATAKTLLTYPGSTARKQTLPAGQTPEQDLEDVIENVFNHPNVGPFIAEQLIQRLVTSNPSGGYVYRIAAVFNDNGAGVRGDLRAVVKAILLDSEARAPAAGQASSFGKLREPIQRFTQFHRAFGAKRSSGYYDIYDLGGSDSLGQSPVRAPSVFNYYHADFAPSGVLASAGLVGPEFEITNSATISGFMDFSKYGIINGFDQYASDTTRWLKPDYSAYISMAGNPTQLVDALNLVLMAGSMSAQFRTQLIDVATKLTDGNATTQSTERVKTVLWLMLNSPEYSIQK